MSAMTPARLRCVVIDDDPEFLERVQRWFVTSCTDLEVVSFASGLDAVEFLRRERADLVLTGYLMPQIDGLQLISIIRALHLHVPIYMASHVPIRAVALARGATEFFAKGSLWARLESAVATLRERGVVLAA